MIARMDPDQQRLTPLGALRSIGASGLARFTRAAE